MKRRNHPPPGWRRKSRAHAPSTNTADAPNHRPRRALIVHTDQALAERLARELQGRDWRTIIAGDGERALELAHYAVPDLVVLDAESPTVDVPALLLQLRELPVGDPIMIVVKRPQS